MKCIHCDRKLNEIDLLLYNIYNDIFDIRINSKRCIYCYTALINASRKNK